MIMMTNSMTLAVAAASSSSDNSSNNDDRVSEGWVAEAGLQITGATTTEETPRKIRKIVMAGNP